MKIRHALSASALGVTALMVAGCDDSDNDVDTGSSDSSTPSSLVSRMSTADKIAMLHGTTDPEGLAGAGYLAGVPRLGIPPLRLTDGPLGVRTTEPATAMPAPIGLASTFDPSIATRYGEVIGVEGKSHRQDVLLSPMTNIVRTPLAGRNFETLGEDPYLASRMVTGEIEGIQRQGLMATVKHYVANNQERDRMSIDANVGQRALREIYLPAFKAAVDADVASIMCAYNRLNGNYNCENDETLNTILRDEWGYQGFVMSDWYATHSTEDSIRAGLDMEMPNDTYYGDALRNAVNDGTVDEGLLNRSVERILGQMSRFGLLGHDRNDDTDVDTEANAQISRDTAEAGSVLLRNENATLPWNADQLGTVAVIGPTAERLLFGGGGSSAVNPLETVSPLDALRRALGDNADIRYAPGISLDGDPVPASALRAGNGGDSNGLQAMSEGGTQRVDQTVDFVGDDALTAGSQWTWTGRLVAPESGDYRLLIQTAGGAGTVTLDGEEIATTGGLFSNRVLQSADGLSVASQIVSLEAGSVHELEITGEAGAQIGVTEGDPDSKLQIRFAWVSPEIRRQTLADARTLASQADHVVVFGFNEGSEGEDRDTLDLPLFQNDMINAVTEAADDPVVVLNTDGPVTMPWLDQSGAVLETWYPGQEGGLAIAAMLLGDATPGGRLPVTFPTSLDDSPTASDRRYPGVDGVVHYDEGVLVGYRWYDYYDVAPLFAFGYGLTYGNVTYSGAQLTHGDSGYVVRVTARNDGDHAAVAVPQVYVGAASGTPVVVAPKQLAGFARATLEPGDSQEIEIPVTDQVLRYWSEDDNDWTPAAGQHDVYLGQSIDQVSVIGQISVD
ncbi:glycoside hydrolase family 3 protein [Salinisphaera sp. Q1T1-3]|uniref:glycoside hydrolase family 3 protein n=1 Tax=Salinisphaera sp. Q1T1-3 TaxID=2321229 RepID=UPI000E740985|nr:glycoside hydrolase family 3 C-terminal domain-containing protein [Salinisphaera sp. Q1T1-3]RJS95145.1 beta-glucosidase [Salinisphaera sp. Q1T1-3]